MVLCTMISWNIQCWLYMMILLYDVGYVKWTWYLSKLLYVVMTTYDDMWYEAKHNLWYPILLTWLCGGYGASHEHFTCRLGIGLLVKVLYVMLIWTIELVMLIWFLCWWFFVRKMSCVIVVLILYVLSSQFI